MFLSKKSKKNFLFWSNFFLSVLSLANSVNAMKYIPEQKVNFSTLRFKDGAADVSHKIVKVEDIMDLYFTKVKEFDDNPVYACVSSVKDLFGNSYVRLFPGDSIVFSKDSSLKKQSTENAFQVRCQSLGTEVKIQRVGVFAKIAQSVDTKQKRDALIQKIGFVFTAVIVFGLLVQFFNR